MKKEKTDRKRINCGLRLRLRIVGLSGDAFGPGKAQLLEEIEKTGSLREAAAALEMSYMKAWRLTNAMKANFRAPLLEKSRGGSTRGGTQLTESGRKVLAIYHRMTSQADRAAQKEWKTLSTFLKK